MTYRDTVFGGPGVDVLLLMGDGLIVIVHNLEVLLNGCLVQSLEEGKAVATSASLSTMSSAASLASSSMRAAIDNGEENSTESNGLHAEKGLFVL